MTMNTEQQLMWNTIADEPSTYYMEASESEREIMREWVRSVLRDHGAEITFVKADGTERTMPCTLQESRMPKTPEKTTTDRKYNPDVCVVFDPERQVWRSFRWDRMKRIEFTLG
jgi:hypothetical protein